MDTAQGKEPKRLWTMFSHNAKRQTMQLLLLSAQSFTLNLSSQKKMCFYVVNVKCNRLLSRVLRVITFLSNLKLHSNYQMLIYCKPILYFCQYFEIGKNYRVLELIEHNEGQVCEIKPTVDVNIIVRCQLGHF